MANQTKITERQLRFVNEFLKDLNAKRAAIRAGYSEKTAQEQASRLLSNVKVQAAINSAKKKRQDRTNLTLDKVVRELEAVAFSRMDDFAKWDSDGVRLIPSRELEDEAAACVAEVSQTTTLHGGSIKFKLHNKVEALKLLKEHLSSEEKAESENGIDTYVEALQSAASDVWQGEEIPGEASSEAPE